MKKLKTIVLALAFSVLALLPGRADDGSWSADFTEAAGPVYATIENQDISLESELLRFRIVKQGVTEAVFLFRNASARELHVEAGFPVRIRMSVAQLDLPVRPGKKAAPALYFSQGKYDNQLLGLAAAKAFYGDALYFDESEYPDGAEYGGAWYLRKEEAAARRMVKVMDFRDPFSFSIAQDGTPVPWDTVFLESKVIDQLTLELSFHFHHMITFKPSASSMVTFSYSQDSLRGMESGAMRSTARYGWEYVLGTGRTWKGRIGKLLVCLPMGAVVKLPGAFAPRGAYGAPLRRHTGKRVGRGSQGRRD